MLRSIILFSLLSISLLSAKEVEEFSFIGVTVASDAIDILHVDDSVAAEDTTNIGIRYGKQTLDWRTMFTYARDGENVSISAEIDMILKDDLFGITKLRPYIGVVIGAVNYNELDLLDQEGYFYGGSLGLVVYATDNLDADISYHYYETYDLDEISNIQGGAFALHYFY